MKKHLRCGKLCSRLSTCTNSSCTCFFTKAVGRKCKRRQLRELASKEVDAIVNYYFSIGKVCIFGKMRIDKHPDYHDRVLCNGSVQNFGKSFVELGQYMELSEPFDTNVAGHEYAESEQSVEAMDSNSSGLFDYFEANEGTSHRKRSCNQEVHGGVRANRCIITCKKIKYGVKWRLCVLPR